MTYSSPSSFAVVVTAAESEPKPGSVMAIAAHTLPKRSSCSLVATLEIAALPRPW
jgi:Ni,Fe-hydrogenase maturation factor